MLLTKKEEIEQFKRDLRSLKYYTYKQQELSDKLIELNRSMHEARAVRYDHAAIGGNFNYLELMEKEDALKKELSLLDYLIYRIHNTLEKIIDKKDRQLLINIYVHQRSFKMLSGQFLMSERNLKYYVDSLIKKIL